MLDRWFSMMSASLGRVLRSLMLTMLRTDVIEHMIRYAYAYILKEGHEFRIFELKVSEGMSASLLGCAIEDLGVSLFETNRFQFGIAITLHRA